MAIASGKMVFYYMARDNLCFLTLCEDAYPKRLAFLYLDEIADIIINELQREYGTNVSSIIGTFYGKHAAMFLFGVVRWIQPIYIIFRNEDHYPEHELILS